MKKYSIIIFLITSVCLPSQDHIMQEKMDKIKNAQYVSLVFAGQNLQTPISSFGHTLLLFHKNPIPEPDSIALEFLGNIDTPFFAIKSILWSIQGAFRILYWNEKFWEYEKENRDIWITPLKITNKEKKKMSKIIKDEFSLKKPYNFLFTNCSWHIYKLIRKSLTNFSCSVKFYVYPIDTIQSLNHCNRLGNTIYIPSHATKALYAEKNLFFTH